MSIRSVVTMGYSNGTFSVGTAFIPRAGYSSGTATTPTVTVALAYRPTKASCPTESRFAKPSCPTETKFAQPSSPDTRYSSPGIET